MTTPILEARDLSKLFPGPKKLFTPARFVTAVDRVSLSVMPGETLAIVGESDPENRRWAVFFCACWRPAKDAYFIRVKRSLTPRERV